MSFPHSPNFARVFLLSLTLICFCAAGASAQVQSLTSQITPTTRVALDTDLTVKVTATPASGVTLPGIETVEWVGLGDFFTVKSTTPPNGVPQDGVYTFTLTAKKITDAREITVKLGGQETKFTSAVVPQITKDTLKLDPTRLEVATEKLIIKQQSEVPVRLSLQSGALIPGDALKVESDVRDVATATLNDSTIVVTGRAPGTAKVTIKAYGTEVESFNVQVTETVKEIKADNLTFTNGDPPKPLNSLGITLTGKSDTPWAGSEAADKLNFRISRGSDNVRISTDKKNLEILDAGEAELEISDKEDASRTKIITVTVLPKASKVVFLDVGDNTTIIAGQKKTLQAAVQDEAKRIVQDVAVKFECQGANCAAVNIIPRANNSADVLGISAAAGVKIVAKAEARPGAAAGAVQPAAADILLNVIAADQIVDFRPLLIRMDMIDEQVAKDLFGRKAVDEFYVAKVQLFNRIKKTDKEYFGDSILVYSESLQVRVALELKCRKGDADRSEEPIEECANKEGQWVPITVDMITTHFDDEFSLTPPISGTEPIPRTDDPEPCRIQAPKGFVGLYRPYSFETVAVTHDRRDERSLRSRILTGLNAAISFTSFVTAIAVPGTSSDLPLGLDKSNNLLIPSLEKLFPSMREVQRQNVLTMVMRQLEEIPFGGSVERKIFFPKGALEGLWPGHRVRISGVSTFDACAQAAIIKKVAQQ